MCVRVCVCAHACMDVYVCMYITGSGVSSVISLIHEVLQRAPTVFEKVSNGHSSILEENKILKEKKN